MEGEIASRRVTEEVIGPVEELNVVHHTDLHMGGERETKNDCSEDDTPYSNKEKEKENVISRITPQLQRNGVNKATSNIRFP